MFVATAEICDEEEETIPTVDVFQNDDAILNMLRARSEFSISSEKRSACCYLHPQAYFGEEAAEKENTAGLYLPHYISYFFCLE